MFTVLHRGPDGSETLYQAETVSRFQREGEQCVPAMGSIGISGAKCDGIPLGASITLALEPPFGAVFVMNEGGSTVARWLADPSQPSAVPLAEAA